jgi:PAS domain S-box-containing protein
MLSTTSLGRRLCMGGAGLGVIGLIGWLTGLDVLVTIIPGQPPMMPNTAVALLLLGIAGALCGSRSFASVERSLALLAAISVLFIGLVTLAEYTWELPFSIDEFLFSIDQIGVGIEAGPYAGRPSPPTALALALLAAAIPLWNWRAAARLAPAEWLTLSAGLIAFTAMLGQAFGIGALYRLVPTPIIGVAVHTALGLLLIAVGMLLERPGSRIARIAGSPNAGDIMLRQLALAFILIAVSIGFAGALLSELLGSENAAIIAAGLTVIGIVAGLSLLATTATQLNRVHEALERSQARARDLVELASDGIFIADLDGRYVDVNEAGCRMLGYDRGELVGKTIFDLIRPEDEARLREDRERFLKGGTGIGEWMLRRKDGTYIPVEVSAKILPDGRWEGIVRDVSERRRAQEALKQAQARYQELFESASDGIFISDLDARLTEVNESGCRMLGYSREEMLTKTIADLIPPEDKERLWRHKAELLSGRTDIGEWTTVRKDGAMLPVEVSAKILPDRRWQGIVRDISERKRAEEALRLSQERIELALKGADLATWDWNIKTGEVIFNSRWAEMRGFRPEEVSPRAESWSSGIHPEDSPVVQDRVRGCFEGTHAEFECEYRVATKTGEWIWILDRGKVFARDKQGHPIRMVGTELDVTARKRAEEALRLSEAKFSGIVSISADAIISIDEDQKITLFNEGAEHIFGRSRSEAIGKPLDILIPERFRAVHTCHVKGFSSGADIARRMGARGAAIFGIRKNGQEFPADAAISRMVVGGRRILTVALRDITELKEAEAEAQRATKARDDVLGVVAHDLRNPLAAIAALATVLERKASEREIAEEIAAAASRMDRLIGDLLDVTRIEAGHFSLRQERLPAAEVLSDALEAQRLLASSASLELSLDASSDLPDIWADRDRILQVFENLIGNAVKFTKPSGRITLGATVHGSDVLFSVADTGCGIPPSHLPHVFDRFWQAPGASRRGLGFGLAIVRGIVETHGGRVWVESQTGRGSTFFFTIPRAPGSQVTPTRRSHAAA